MTKETIRSQFYYLVAGVCADSSRQVADNALTNLNLWLCGEPIENIRYVIELIAYEFPGYRNHPTVLDMLEFLEGMIALRRIASGEFDKILVNNN